MTTRRDGTGRTEMWREWAERQSVPPWRQNAPDPEERQRPWQHTSGEPPCRRCELDAEIERRAE